MVWLDPTLHEQKPQLKPQLPSIVGKRSKAKNRKKTRQDPSQSILGLKLPEKVLCVFFEFNNKYF